MYISYSFIFALGWIFVTASKVQISPTSDSLYACRTSQSCRRTLYCNASGRIKWLYPNLTVITSTPKFKVTNKILEIFLTHPKETDAGNYTCCLVSDSTKRASVMLRVIVDPVLIYGSSPLHENKTALCYHDIFLNCSVNPANTSIAWEFRPNHVPLYTRNTNKYAENSSGLTIYDVTNDDQGLYVCVVGNVNPLEAFISLNVTCKSYPYGSPQLVSLQNDTLMVNISMQVILNCTASALPDPVYSWSFPDTCLSCPHSHHSDILNFTANTTNSGKYVCLAENEYGNISKTFSVHVHSKPIMNVEHQLKIMERAENIMLTCDIQYAYPTPSIEWNITTSSGFSVMKQNSNGNLNYKDHGNRSIEILHRFLSERKHIIILCSATNMHGYSETIFHLWEHSTFFKEQEFVLYIKNITNCYQIAQDTDGLLAKLIGSLRQWFNSTCNCDGYNNLYDPRLSCLNAHTGNITSTVHHDGLSAAKELIELTTADIQMRDPPIVNLTNGWILFLNASLDPNTTAFANDKNNNGSLGLSVLITISVASFCTILALIFCITVGLVYIKHKRQSITDVAVGAANSDVKVADNKKNQEANSPHIYEEITQNSPKCSKTTVTNDESTKLKDEVVFDAVLPPAYQIIATSSRTDNKTTRSRSNDYYIAEDDIGLNKDLENSEENSQTDKDFKNFETYNKLKYCNSQ